MMLEGKKLGVMQSESTIRRLHVPVLRPEDVIHHLGSPTHWQPGRSAKSVADLWFSANGLPPSVKSALDHDPAFKGATLVDAFFERPVDLGDGQRPSQTDLMAILRLDGRLGVLAVEAKVDETFGPTVQEWLSEAKGDATARPARLERLCRILDLDPATVGTIRYQLIHRTASAIIEAQRYCARDVAMIVQSFCPKRSWFDDYRAFAEAMGFPDAPVGTISPAKVCDGVELRIGWVAEPAGGSVKPLGTARTVPSLTDLGRVQLSKSFFMRDMLYSEVAMIHGFNNAPDDPELAIKAGKRLAKSETEQTLAQIDAAIANTSSAGLMDEWPPELIDACSALTSHGYYVGDLIPEKKRAAAMENYPLPGDGEILALIDGTVFGSAAKGLAVGEDGIAWKNGSDPPNSQELPRQTRIRLSPRDLSVADQGAA